ncbi:permease [Paenibacillus sp. CCS19]|uniref:permease n=1 Tax=Paenibacillus sp. CCS19 TaxID=3158387 RepID=UPI00256D616C|nr:permease [Paenibacillus cellulosilyticus]GMK40053.1 permease [Paenibacillus cellulosilyticus]
MFAGHFGLAAIVKSRTSRVPLWALMVSSQLLDVAFIPMVMTGAESMDETVYGGGYGEVIIHADYTHSLLGAIILTLVAALAGRWIWGKRAGAIIGAVVISHWLLDLLVHRADMPILPANWGDLPLLGFGLWQFPWITITLEALLIAAGTWMYARASLQRKSTSSRLAPVSASALLGAVLVLLLVSDAAGWF